jgi:4,5-DOPA dioxygenase extradiol
MDARSSPLPALFLSHGSPMTALEPREAGAFLQRLGPAITRRFGRPRAILAVSAHSLAREPVLLAAARHEAVYDFGNFDDRLFTLRYDVPGAPALAERVAALLKAAGLPAHVAAEGGLDHGIWTPLRYAFPDADIPVLPLAWPPNWTPAQLFALGRALAPLAARGHGAAPLSSTPSGGRPGATRPQGPAEGVLVVGSGSITHNLRRVFAGGMRPAAEQPATPESTAFRDWFAARTAAGDWPSLFDYRRQAPHAVLMHPTDEHLLPFFVAAGAGGEGAPAQRIHASLTYGDLGMDAYAFGAGAAALAERESALAG